MNFDFPVTALIGPNGSGKSTILGAAACAYTNVTYTTIFKKSRVGDSGMNDWKLEFEKVDKTLNPKGTIRSALELTANQWHDSGTPSQRSVKPLTLNRTVPAIDNPLFSFRKQISIHGSSNKNRLLETEGKDIDQIRVEAERILNKPLGEFKLYEYTFGRNLKARPKFQTHWDRIETFEDGSERILKRRVEIPVKEEVLKRKVSQFMYVGKRNGEEFSEFNFGSGESAVLRMLAEIEALPDNSLLLIEEIENGLHPIAVERMVEYLIALAERKKIQTIFTTHSDYALNPLPTEAIWLCMEGEVRQGKIPVEVLRFLTSRVDQKLAVFVEDVFAKDWIQHLIREAIPDRAAEIGVYPVEGDGNAVELHRSHGKNPSITFKSVCFIDGDSEQNEDVNAGVYRLPGKYDPEIVVFDSVRANLGNNIGLLTVALQQSSLRQTVVKQVVEAVSRSNRDPHLLFAQIAEQLGFMAEAVVRGAFLAVWMKENPQDVERIVAAIKAIVD